MSRRWFEAASTNYDDALKLAPGDAALAVEAGQAHFLFGSELGKSGKPALAAREFAQAARLMPEVMEARLNLGIALYQQGQWKQSLEQFEQVSARSPTNALARQYLALLRGKLGAQGER
jgi:tetratricopeptide (TPR) repeat protein